MNSQASDPGDDRSAWKAQAACSSTSSRPCWPIRAAALSARTQLYLGQAVRFVDFRDGQMRNGKIVAFRDTQATVLELGTKQTWRISYLSMQGYADAERQGEQT